MPILIGPEAARACVAAAPPAASAERRSTPPAASTAIRAGFLVTRASFGCGSGLRRPELNAGTISSDHQTEALSNHVARVVATSSAKAALESQSKPAACQFQADGVTSSLVCWSDKPMNYQPLERRKVYEQIAEQLLGQIRTRRLKPGDSLPPERELTESFSVGRSSIREALRMLESKGVITPVSGG